MKTISFIISTIGKSIYLEELLLFLISSKLGKIVVVDNSIKGITLSKFILGNIFYIRSITQGISKARNLGANAVDSDYLYFLDDDLLPINSSQRIKSLCLLLSGEGSHKCVGGNILLPKDSSINVKLPKKYRYIYGEKDFGKEDFYLKNNYFGGANIIFNRSLFFKLGCFPDGLGHNGNKRRFNEEIYLQDRVKKKGNKLYFKSGIDFYHMGYKSFSEFEIFERILLQGKCDCIVDIKLNKYKLFLRIIKYTFLIIYDYFSKLSKYDKIKYQSYLQELGLQLFNKGSDRSAT